MVVFHSLTSKPTAGYFKVSILFYYRLMALKVVVVIVTVNLLAKKVNVRRSMAWIIAVSGLV